MTATESARAANVLVHEALAFETALRQWRVENKNGYYSGPDTTALEAAVSRFRDEATAAALEHWWGFNEERFRKLDDMVAPLERARDEAIKEIQ